MLWEGIASNKHSVSCSMYSHSSSCRICWDRGSVLSSCHFSSAWLIVTGIRCTYHLCPHWLLWLLLIFCNFSVAGGERLWAATECHLGTPDFLYLFLRLWSSVIVSLCCVRAHMLLCKSVLLCQKLEIVKFNLPLSTYLFFSSVLCSIICSVDLKFCIFQAY